MRVNHTYICIVVILLMMFSRSNAQAVPSSDQVLEATKRLLDEGKSEEGIEKMSAFIERTMQKSIRPPSRTLEDVSIAACAIRFMELYKDLELTSVVTDWLLSSPERLESFVNLLKPEDDKEGVVGIIHTLLSHDPEGCERYDRLVFALALVWDTPKRPLTHYQMGEDLLSYKANVLARYDFFKALYEEKRALMPYERLGIRDLVFVVETPVPISELKWVHENLHPKENEWGRYYSSIRYADSRIAEKEYDWPECQKTYTLRTIQALGGICVDQSYFSVMAARAYGVPAMYMHGRGVSSGHAWLAHLGNDGEWILDVGRYESQSYTTGFSVDPQTNEEMTDHDIEYIQDRTFSGLDFEKACDYLMIAEVLKKVDPDGSRSCAHIARTLSPRFYRPWELERELLVAAADYDGLMAWMQEQKSALRKYPDLLNTSAKAVAEVLKEAGRHEDAQRVVALVGNVVGNDRDDLKRFVEIQEIEAILAAGDCVRARKKMESLLEDNLEEGSKIFTLISKYLDVTNETKQTRPAARFMEKYMEEFIRKNRFSPAYKQRSLFFLKVAYINDRNKKKAAQVERRIQFVESYPSF